MAGKDEKKPRAETLEQLPGLDESFALSANTSLRSLDVGIPPELDTSKASGSTPSTSAPSTSTSSTSPSSLAQTLPPPDLLDKRGRLRRLSIALVLGSVAAAITYMICTKLAIPDEGATRGAFKFVGYMTGLVGAGVFGGSLALLNHRDKRAFRDQESASARVVK